MSFNVINIRVYTYIVLKGINLYSLGFSKNRNLLGRDFSPSILINMSILKICFFDAISLCPSNLKKSFSKDSTPIFSTLINKQNQLNFQ